MKPGEKITSNYDLDAIASETIRESEATRVVAGLDTLFAVEPDKIAFNRDVQKATEEACSLVNGSVLVGTSFGPAVEASKPYDAFESQGVNYQSRLLRVRTGDPRKVYPDTNNHLREATVYFVGLFGQGQTNASSNNFKFGFIKTDDGEHAFFKCEYSSGEDGEFSVTPLTPEEQYAVVQELAKAVTAGQ